MIGSNRVSNVFDVLLSHELEIERRLTSSRCTDRLGNANAAWLGKALQAGSHVDTVPLDVICQLVAMG